MKTRLKINDHALRQAVQPGLERIGREFVEKLNQLGEQYQGRPIEELKVALVDLHRRRGGSITEPELTKYAEALAAGTRLSPSIRTH